MKARRLINAGLEYFVLKPEDLQTLMKGDERKLALAVLVRKRTPVSNHWLAAALNLGHASRVSHALHGADDLKSRECLVVMSDIQRLTPRMLSFIRSQNHEKEYTFDNSACTCWPFIRFCGF